LLFHPLNSKARNFGDFQGKKGLVTISIYSNILSQVHRSVQVKVRRLSKNDLEATALAYESEAFLNFGFYRNLKFF